MFSFVLSFSSLLPLFSFFFFSFSLTFVLLLFSLDLHTVLDREVKDLSGGELQRFAIASLALRDLDVYMFDEPSRSGPTARGSDPRNRRKKRSRRRTDK